MSQAEPGFPWFGQNIASAPQGTLEKPVDTQRALSDASDAAPSDSTLSNSQSKAPSEKQKSSVKSRKGSGSLRPSSSNKSPVKPLIDQRNRAAPPRHYNVRTIPPWVADAEEDDLDCIAEVDLDSPHTALVAQHNHAPSQKNPPRGYAGYPMSSGEIRPERTSRWITFARASAYPREDFRGEQVDTEWLNQNFTDYSKPWLAGQDEHDPEKGSGIYRAFRRKRQAWYKRMQITILRHPFVPLAFRATILVFAAAAIGLGSSIYREANLIEGCAGQALGQRTPNCAALIGQGEIDYSRDPSALMAIIVDAIAIAYTLYITYDEYFSKPLGLRPARAKVRLVLLDLFFIVFQAANLALAFGSLTVDEGACIVGEDPATTPRFDKICDRAQALSGVLTVSLVAWLFTFSVSILRLVERINTR